VLKGGFDYGVVVLFVWSHTLVRFLPRRYAARVAFCSLRGEMFRDGAPRYRVIPARYV
jgi:hypothetical protein